MKISFKQICTSKALSFENVTDFSSASRIYLASRLNCRSLRNYWPFSQSVKLTLPLFLSLRIGTGKNEWFCHSFSDLLSGCGIGGYVTFMFYRDLRENSDIYAISRVLFKVGLTAMYDFKNAVHCGLK